MFKLQESTTFVADGAFIDVKEFNPVARFKGCLLYTSDAADE